MKRAAVGRHLKALGLRQGVLTENQVGGHPLPRRGNDAALSRHTSIA